MGCGGLSNGELAGIGIGVFFGINIFVILLIILCASRNDYGSSAVCFMVIGFVISLVASIALPLGLAFGC